eukprot:7972691-Pyramimonas_sp.AAC.1
MGTASTLKGKGSVTTIAPMHPKPRRATAPTPAHRSSASSGTTARNSVVGKYTPSSVSEPVGIAMDI